MSRIARSVTDYWHDLFTAGMIVGNPAVAIAVNPALDHARRAMIMTWADGSVGAALTPALAERIGADALRRLSVTGLRMAMAAAGVALHDADLVFHLPAGPVHAPAVPVARQLGEADRPAFDAFRAAAPGDDLDAAAVDLDHWAAFGSFDGERLVSVASAYPWGGAPIADLGLLTLPGDRGQGHARAVIGAIGRFARERGHEPQYRCQADNAASAAVARALGMVLLGRWEVAVDAAGSG